MSTGKQRLAIVGTGIAGLGCAWLLREHFDLTLFEQNDYVGGHTNTVQLRHESRDLPVDTGFMVFNHVTYPLLTRLFSELGVETKATSMSFSVRHEPTEIEYNGTDVNHLFAQRRNLLRPRFWRFLLQIGRFNREAVAALDDAKLSRMTVSEYVSARGYGEDFLNLYLVPMSAAVWSSPPEKMLQFPARTLLRFWHNHGFLGLHTQHPWRTVVNGAQSYVKKILATAGASIRLNAPVVKIQRHAGRVDVTTEQSGTETFDKVIMAAHADQSLRVLSDPTELEFRLLSCFKYQPNIATVHTDATVMPKLRRCWASWNYRVGQGSGGGLSPSTHYWMNSLQGLPRSVDYFVSINGEEAIAPEHVLRRIHYDHPLFDLPAVEAQKELPSLNRLDRGQTTFYCGSYFRYGFHEDAFRSAVDLCRDLLGKEPW